MIKAFLLVAGMAFFSGFALFLLIAIAWAIVERIRNTFRVRHYYKPLPGFEPVDRGNINGSHQPTPIPAETVLYPPRKKGTSRSSKHWRKAKRDAAREAKCS